MRVVLIIQRDAALRRRIAEVLLRAGYGVCETHSGDLVPAVPRLDAVLTDGPLAPERFRAPVVPIPTHVDVDDIVARLHLAISEEPAA